MLSAEMALEDCEDSTVALDDWEHLEKTDLISTSAAAKFMSKAVLWWPFKHSGELNRIFDPTSRELRRAATLLSFLEAHAAARLELQSKEGVFAEIGHHNSQQDCPVSSKAARDRICDESREECAKAQAVLAAIPSEFKEVAKCEMLARKLLRSQKDHIHHMEEHNLITHAEAKEMVSHVSKAMVNVMYTPKEQWLAILNGQKMS
jgi:hypothetical protein